MLSTRILALFLYCESPGPAATHHEVRICAWCCSFRAASGSHTLAVHVAAQQLAGSALVALLAHHARSFLWLLSLLVHLGCLHLHALCRPW